MTAARDNRPDPPLHMISIAIDPLPRRPAARSKVHLAC
jgi:hypothetical protein